MNCWVGKTGWVVALMTASAMGQTVSGSGTSGTVPVFIGSSAVGNSPISVSGGNVGIGTASPDIPLALGASQTGLWGGATTLDVYVGGDGAARFQQNGGVEWGTYMGNYIAPPSGMIIPGNVGIGTTTPSYPLVVNGTVNADQYGGGTSSAFLASSTSPAYAWFLSGQATDQKEWDALGVGTTLLFRTVNDANSNANTWMQVNRGSGFTISSVAFPSGNVGIGTTSPAYALDVVGQMHASSGVVYPDGTQQTTAWTGVLCGGDYAEDMRAQMQRDPYEPGDVLVLTSDDGSDVQKSSGPYSTMVAGIYATKPGVVGLRDAVAKSSNNVPMAMVGVVPTKVTAENGPIHKGDLLVSSSAPGYAMKGTDRSRMLGAVLGKAMGSLDSGEGVIEVLVTLQ